MSRTGFRGSPGVAVAAAIVLVVAGACGGGMTSRGGSGSAPSGPAASAAASGFAGGVAGASASPSAETPAAAGPSAIAGALTPGPASQSRSGSAAASLAATLPACPRETASFPAGYTAYHTYAGLCRALVQAAKAHPDIARLFSIGRSAQGRTIWAMEISTHLSDGTHPPGVLFDGNHHALEHLSLEMTLAIAGWLLDGYGHDTTITRLVRTRAIFIIFDVNPDGAAYDIAGGRFHGWRKNRQPEPGGAIGTDLNRNYANHWGCCGLVSSNPASAYYRGTAPFSAPETRAVADFIRSLVFGGRQEIRVAITFHTSGRLILWPYGYTRSAVASGMSADDHAVFVALARAMARRNGYLPEQASGLYVDSGTARDWYYGSQGIFAFTFELATGLYQPSAAIAREAARNKSAILYLIGMADCPYRAIGKAAAHC